MLHLPRRNLAFSEYCELRVTYCMKTFAWRPFFTIIILWQCEHGEGPDTHRESKTNIQTCDPPHFLCRRDPVCLAMFGKFFHTADTHTECEFGHQTLVTKFTFFSLLALKQLGLATASNSIKYPFSYFWLLAFWSTLWDFWSKQATRNS